MTFTLTHAHELKLEHNAPSRIKRRSSISRIHFGFNLRDAGQSDILVCILYIDADYFLPIDQFDPYR